MDEKQRVSNNCISESNKKDMPWKTETYLQT